MVRSVYIRSLAGLLLVIFALSITPKKFLHNVFAKHIDNRCTEAGGQPYQLTASGYICDDDNQVAESSFVNIQHSFSFTLPTAFHSYIFKDISFSSTAGIFSPLRGPPVNI